MGSKSDIGSYKISSYPICFQKFTSEIFDEKRDGMNSNLFKKATPGAK